MLNQLASALPPLPLKFSFDRAVLDGAADVALQLHADDPAVQQALLHNLDVPKPDEPILVGAAQIDAGPGKELAFGGGAGTVTFSGKAGAKFGIFAHPGQLRDAIVDGGDLAESIESAISFDTGVAQPFLLLRLAYDVNAAAKGAVALGAAGSFGFGANAGRNGLYALVRQTPVGLGIRDAIAGMVRGVRLPRQVQTADDLAPGTWMIAEVDGSIGVRAEVTFGHDLTWIRETSLGTLEGDVGLKVAAGISAALGFSAAGKYAVVLSRESLDPASRVLRLRVFKLRMREWDFAFNAQATVTPVAGILPEQFDDFLAGLLGTHSGQIMAALQHVDDWTDPAAPLFGPFVNLALDEARSLVTDLTGVTDIVGEFEGARGQFRRLAAAWRALPHGAATRVAKLAGNSAAVARTRDLADQIAGGDLDAVKTLIANRLRDVSFLQSAEGGTIAALVSEGLFAALTNPAVLDRLRLGARSLLQLLDGAAVEKLLTRLQKEIEHRLSLAQIDKAVDAADPALLDPWLRARLERFLEERIAGPDGVARLQQLRANLRAIRAAMPELYKKALTALQNDYAFSLNSTYTRTSTSTALVDVELDFAAAGSQAAELLRVALQGRFDDVIGRESPGVRVREGALIDAVRTQSSVSVALPFFSRTQTHINDAMAQLSRVSQSDGRLYFHLAAQDLVEVKNSYAASLSVSVQLARADRATGVQVHSDESAGYVQTITRAFADETVDEFVRYAGAFVEPLFRAEFGTSDFGTWAREAFGASGSLGKMLMRLQVTLPPSACLAWLSAPADPKADAYQRLSLRLQAAFKQLIHDTFFQRIDRYDAVSAQSDAFAILVFTSIPPSTAAGGLYWDHVDPDVRRAMVTSPATVQRLSGRMALARARLQGAGDPRNKIPFYKESQLSTVISIAQDSEVMRSLLFVEAQLVARARDAALAMAKFTATSMADPSQARRSLAAFGTDVTEAFNSRLKNVAVSDALLPLGALLFVEAARALDPQLDAATSAMLAVTDVKDTIVFPPANFPNHDALPAADIVRTEVLVHTPLED